MRVAAPLLAILVLPLVMVAVPAHAMESCTSIVYEVLPDGSVQANATIQVASAPSNVTLFFDWPVFVAAAWAGDGIPLPVDFEDGNVTVYVFDNGTVNVTVVSIAATAKEGAIWIFQATPPCKALVVLPVKAVPVSIEPESFNVVEVDGRLGLEFPAGTTVRVEYVLVPQAGEGGAGAGQTVNQTQAPTGATATAPSGGGTGEATSPSQPGGSSGLLLVGVAAAASAAAIAAWRLSSRKRGAGGQARLDDRDRAILRALEARPMTASELMDATGIPRTPLYRRLKRLIEEGLIEAVEEGGVRRYRLKRGPRL